MGGHNCTIADVKRSLSGWRAAAILCVATGVWGEAQPLSVYSEFARIDRAGNLTAPESPREILSPALVRNGFTSFQVVVHEPADKDWWLFVSQNPESSVRVTMYRESEGGMEPVEVPRKSNGTEVLWMDVWTDTNAPVSRIKLEPQLYVDDDWVIYPIEGRIVAARIPDPGLPPGSYLCPLVTASPALAMSRLQLRNAAQDFALAQEVAQKDLNQVLMNCDKPAPPRWSENYLRIRDYLLRLR